MSDRLDGRSSGRSIRSTLTALVAVFAFSGVLAAPGAVAVGTCTPGDKPDVFPVDDLAEGMTGTGWTAIHGRTPEPFDVEIVGVLQDGIAPGLDFILVATSGPLIDETDGVMAGFSGSPVYIGGELVGAIAYGFFGEPTLAGVTPAENMVAIFDYPGGVVSGPAHEAPVPARTVKIGSSLRQAAARVMDRSATSVPTSASQLAIPMSVPQLNPRAMTALQEAIDERGWPVSLYPGGSVGAPDPSVPSPTPIAPGEPLAALVSYGDFTIGGVGTATAVCGNLVLGFGHPAFWVGPTALGLNAADVLAVVNGPFDRFKLAELGEPHGTLDQDRLAAVRGVEGVFPALTDIDSSVESPDLGTSRIGETKVALRDAMPFVTAFHTLSNLDVVYDGIRGGSSRISWVAQGHREDGTPFTVTREDMYHSGFDITFESIFDMWFALESLVFFPDETVSFDSVDIEGSVTEEDLRANIVKVLTKSTLQPALKERTTLKAAPGTDITVRAILERADGSTFPVDLTLRVPRGRRADGILKVRGAGFSGGFFFGPGGVDGEEPPEPGEEEPYTIDSIIEEIEGRPHAFDLIATLFPNSPVFKKQKTLAQDVIVLGSRVVRIDVVS